MKLTAVAKPAVVAPWPTQQKVKNLAEILDRRYADYQAMQKLAERLETTTQEWARKPLIQEAQKVIELFEAGGGRHAIKDGRLEKLWDACCPESWWLERQRHSRLWRSGHDDYCPHMGSFPTAKIPEPEILVPVLLDDVMAMTASFVEMESTCRQLRKTKKFMTSVSEVIETLEEQQKLWHRRSIMAWCIEEYYNDLCAEVAKAKAAEAAR